MGVLFIGHLTEYNIYRIKEREIITMKCYTVHYTANTYNPYKTYYQNQNRYARSKSFDTEAEARAFASAVKGRVYRLGVRI